MADANGWRDGKKVKTGPYVIVKSVLIKHVEVKGVWEWIFSLTRTIFTMNGRDFNSQPTFLSHAYMHTCITCMRALPIKTLLACVVVSYGKSNGEGG